METIALEYQICSRLTTNLVRQFPLAAQAEVGDQRAVPAQVFGLQVVQQPAALTDLQQQPATAVVIFFVDLEVLGQMVDGRGENRDLYFGRAGVVGTAAVFPGDFGFAFFGERHEKRLLQQDGLARVQGWRSAPATG